ncbi:D-alanyl-D-alanine carboxypeptidase family protein [Pseudaestuariivita rosea]|uniref:D-alanyl-D-alanine carboxypeptidase family protein n=1 Tax=Pseudaestuariivita rosea TaxID=2763263 RepID=UPI001ABB3ED7
MVMDARSGEVLHSRNADTRLHPASLTKMMTLYIAFEAVQRGEITMDTKVLISRKAAAEPPSKIGLKPGQRIELRYLVRAAAIKSANDAATAIGEAISGSEAAFARRMNRTAKALGMTRTTFKNAHGLTEAGHLSTARDMTNLGRRLFYDYPQYYNIFSRRSTDAGIRKVSNTNTRLLDAYEGADGIKTGYTRAAGFNLVASAEKGNERIIATVFGGNSTASRNKRVAELLDMGFNRAPTRVAVRKPTPPVYSDGRRQVATAVSRSLRPQSRPDVPRYDDAIELALQDGIQQAVEQAITANSFAATETVRPQPRPQQVAMAAVRPEATRAITSQIVTRVSTSGDRHWGINIGRYGSRHEAERVLLRTALAETNTLDGALRKVVKQRSGFDANFLGMTKGTASQACRRLEARSIDCKVVGPG